MILVNNLHQEACYLHLETISTEKHRGMIESFVTLCDNNNRSRTNDLVLDNASNMDVAAEKLQCSHMSLTLQMNIVRTSFCPIELYIILVNIIVNV